MTEYTLTNGELAGTPETGNRSRAAAAWVLRLAGLLLLAGWSAKWLPPMFGMVREQTAIGQHGLRGVPNGYEIFELLFVAGHCAVRWLPGVAAALALLWVSARLRRRRASR